MAPSRRSSDSDSAAYSDSSDSYKGEKQRGKPAPRVSSREERSRGGDRRSMRKSRDFEESSDSGDRDRRTSRSNGRDLLSRRYHSDEDEVERRRRRPVNDKRREREPQPPEHARRNGKEEAGGNNQSQKDEVGDREEGELAESYKKIDGSPKWRDRDGRSDRDVRGLDKNKDDRMHSNSGNRDNEGHDLRKHKDDRPRDSVRIRNDRMPRDSRDSDEDGGGERRHKDVRHSGRMKDENRDRDDRGLGRRRDERRHMDRSDSDEVIEKRKDDLVIKRDRGGGQRRDGDSDSDEEDEKRKDGDHQRRHRLGRDSGRMKDDRRRKDNRSSDKEDDEEGRHVDGRGVGRGRDMRRRMDSSDSDEEVKKQKGVGLSKREREERQWGNRDSQSDEEDEKRKGDRVKNRNRETRQRRHRDGGSDEADAKRKDDRVGRRDRESRRRRGRESDSSGGSPRRKEKTSDDGERRQRDEEKNREKGTKEDTKKDEPAVVQQMPDANVIRTGGIYIPPHRMAQMMRDVQDKSSEQYQRLSWDALRKSINGLVNKVNATNIKNIIPELFSENLIRGRGLFCRSCMKSQMASPGFTDVFAALAAVVNTKFPEVGKLLLKRIVLQLKRAYKRNDKPQLLAATKFIAHLVNQQVAHEIIALELLTLLLENPTDDSVEVAVGFVKECGALLQDFSPQGLHGIFERFRGILHEGEIDKRVQFLIEGLFAIRKAKFQGFPAIRPELDLVEQEDQFTHEVSLDDEIDPETGLDVFKPNPQFLEDEKAYEDLKRSILGDESSDDEEGSDAASDDEDEEESEEEEEENMQIKDETETNLVNLRRTIYLTIMSSVDFEEAGHKLLKIKLEPGQEMELCIMLLECCSQERTYLRYYGLLGQRFCMINKVYQENFEKCFVQQYSMIHRLETNKLRNVAKFFAHLLGTSALPWHVLAYIRLTEEDTTSSSRIFIKILFQELSEHLGIRLLNERLNDPTMQESFESIFPKDNPKNTRFSINFFTSIGLGGITESLREYLKNMPRLIMQQQKPVSESESDDESGSSSSDSDASSESDSSSSESEKNERDRKRRRRS